MRWPRSLRRPWSLRTRVALASAATAAVVVAVMSTVLFAVASSDARTQVGTVVQALAIRSADGTVTTEGPQATVTTRDPAGLPHPAAPLVTAPGTEISALPALPAPNLEYARTIPVDGQTVVLAVPQTVATDSATKQRTRIIAIGVAGTVLAALLGWFFASRAVAPLRRLTAETAELGDRLELDSPKPSAASETAELADAMNSMLGRIADERRHTSEALVTARDFAATAAHELRTPLTAMRTDLQVLRGMPLSESERTEILDEVLAGQTAIETTLHALERLAVGDLTTESDWEDVDLGQLIDQVVDDALRANPGVRIETEGVEPIRLRGLAAGLRSVLENAIVNAVRHGSSTHIDIAAGTSGDTVTLTIDDNGSGVPASERERVFERFYRASRTPGSGLGLALVAQQADLHGGTATLDDSPLGGTRLVMTMEVGQRRIWEGDN
ncbi:HAMP domain-containing histidine kinase [Nocardia sp. NBC_01503]|uniref:sensor histidine kinase n=1 Tax=Nocardia sp. NBC_01503 TaxID=2975997 RepID=UPI002E7BCC03|nr:HAMP domain-containing sensor histidine kinase [Nocardia sp. NBC_01503]WTL33699.1 HAMP domain-containing histidine kinase [Nocardia sp. NBC_01503]